MVDECYAALEQAVSVSGLLGYLNFSDGRPDPRWQKPLNDAYAFLGGDPFVLSDAYPPGWDARGELPALSCPAEPPPRRTVADVRALFERHKLMQPTLLGDVQAAHGIGGARSARHEQDAGLSRQLAHGLRHHCGAALLAAG